jgi:hypothetical protein
MERKGKHMRILASRTVLFAVAVLAMSSASLAQLRISVGFGPPAIPVYDQPVCPGDGYIWTPGYWAWDDDAGDYYWVPGTWVLAPEPGFFWTPPYWAWVDGGFVFYDGWWGPHVGFYGGINYGFGYFGEGFVGGRWQGDHFFYNRDVSNVNVTVIHNVYNEHVTYNNQSRVSYNGGNGGVMARPTPQDESYAHERHLPAVANQVQHMRAARGNPELRASANHGRPPIAATARPGEFSGHEVVAAREAGGAYKPPANRGRAEPRTEAAQPHGENPGHPAVHPNELAPIERHPAPNTGNADLDRKNQQRQQKLEQKQEQERQKLQQKQDQEHQRAGQQHASEQQKQQMEERHQQQTQRLQQRHVQQQQHLEQRQAPRNNGPHK